MIVNESQRDKTNQSQSIPTLKSGLMSEQSQQSNNQQHSELMSNNNIIHFQNPYRNRQIYISIFITVLTTLWVQITMQHYAPFVRASQCFFNELILEHDSQDIYEGTDVIYWRVGEYYDFTKIKGVYQRLNKQLTTLNTNSLFKVRQESQINQNQPEIELQVSYFNPKSIQKSKTITYNCSREGFQTLLNQTMFNRSFYEFMWEVELRVIVPIELRQQTAKLQLMLNSNLRSSFLMQFNLQVNILSDDSMLLKATPYSQNNLGVRKLHDNHNMQLSIPYLKWTVLLLFMIVFALEFTFILRKNQQVNYQLRKQIMQEKNIEKLLEEFNQEGELAEVLKVNDSSNESKEQQAIDFSKDSFKIPKKYQLTQEQRIKRIGVYIMVQLIISFCALFSFYNDHNGMVCFFSWMKLMIYLSQTKNRLMVGYLFEQAIPIYLKIFLNIIILITAFVLFDMLSYRTTIKFQTLKLSYFQYFFNYFQYGIYENFILGLQVHGMGAQMFYFFQLMILLYVGNNILQSVLASEVLKNSYLKGVQQMIAQIKIQCPACGAEQHQQKKKMKNQLKNHSNFDKAPALISRFISDYELHGRESGINESSNYNIVVKSPLLSPFFPKKYQLHEEEEMFISPNLRGGKFQKHIKQINKKMQEQQLILSPKVNKLNKYNNKMESHKKIKIQICESRLHGDQRQQKFHKKVRANMDLLFKKIQKFDQIKKEYHKKHNIPQCKTFNEVREEVLSLLLQRIEQLRDQTI